MKDIEKLLNARRVDLSLIPPDQDIIIKIGDAIIGTSKNFGMIVGAPKAGKTKYMSAFAAAAISGIPQFSINVKISEGRTVGYFDTEQGEWDISKMVGLMKAWTGEKNIPDFFQMYSVREDMPEMVLKMVDYYLEKNPCQLLILDGILDMVLDYNNVRESRLFMNWIKNISKTKNLFVLTVLHLGKNEGQTLGHIGSMADRYSQSVMEVTKEDNATFTLKPRLLRSAKNFDPINIGYNEVTRLWGQDESYAPKKIIHEKNLPEFLSREEHFANLSVIFDKTKIRTYPDLLACVTEVYGQSQAWARKCIKLSVSKKWIIRNSDDNYSVNLFI